MSSNSLRALQLNFQNQDTVDEFISKRFDIIYVVISHNHLDCQTDFSQLCSFPLPLSFSYNSSYIRALVISRDKHETQRWMCVVRTKPQQQSPFSSLISGSAPRSRRFRSRHCFPSADTPIGAHLGLLSLQHRKITTCENLCDGATRTNNAQTS